MDFQYKNNVVADHFFPEYFELDVVQWIILLLLKKKN